MDSNVESYTDYLERCRVDSEEMDRAAGVYAPPTLVSFSDRLSHKPFCGCIECEDLAE